MSPKLNHITLSLGSTTSLNSLRRKKPKSLSSPTTSTLSNSLSGYPTSAENSTSLTASSRENLPSAALSTKRTPQLLPLPKSERKMRESSTTLPAPSELTSMTTKNQIKSLEDSREEPRAKSNSKKLRLREKRKPSRNLKPDQTYLTLDLFYRIGN